MITIYVKLGYNTNNVLSEVVQNVNSVLNQLPQDAYSLAIKLNPADNFPFLILAIGLVVDDAIVVLENIYRHIEEGMESFASTIKGTREIANPVILMTLTLIVVYVPIGMIDGFTGQFFTEFAYSLAGAVLISGVIAYILSPMMCSKVLNPEMMSSKLVTNLLIVFLVN